MTHRAFLGLGSNVGDRLDFVEAALAALAPEVTVVRRSTVYETAPWGFLDQDDFLNMVVEAETELNPQELLAHNKAVERRVGRKPRFRNGPREIDIDILVYDKTKIEEPGLVIPHPRLHERAFMLVPLAELVPDMILPGQSESVSSIVRKIDTSGVKPFPVHAAAHD